MTVTHELLFHCLIRHNKSTKTFRINGGVILLFERTFSTTALKYETQIYSFLLVNSEQMTGSEDNPDKAERGPVKQGAKILSFTDKHVCLCITWVNQSC